MTFQPNLEYARQMDAQDPLRSFRDQYLFPQHQGHNCLYFCGNSLGLQPKQARACIETELQPQAEKSAAAAEFAFRNGAIGVMDLLDARRTLRAVQVEAVAARAEHARALAALRAGVEFGLPDDRLSLPVASTGQER